MYLILYAHELDLLKFTLVVQYNSKSTRLVKRFINIHEFLKAILGINLPHYLWVENLPTPRDCTTEFE